MSDDYKDMDKLNRDDTGYALPEEMAPPATLEERIVADLRERGLIAAGAGGAGRSPGWRMVRASLAAAACAGLIAAGFLLGRVSAEVPTSLTTLTGAETDLYALLLYETEGYRRPVGAETLTRYDEYSRWIAEASRRGRFVTGEDLEVESGWAVVPSTDQPTVKPAVAPKDGVPLSGILFIRAADPSEAVELARRLPHVKHGGEVLIQKTIPTDTPPELQQ